jgi:hypothetical protein
MQHELDYAVVYLVAVKTPAALGSFQHADLYLDAAEPPTVLGSIQHVNYNAVLDLVAAETPLALESFEHELDVIDLWLVVAVASVHVDGQAFD